ncbi:MAG TPA: SGNH/GDSL hydrolase family protein [Polyangiaceae bacterium]
MFAWVTLGALAGCSPARTGHDAETHTPLVRFVGRVDTSDPSAARFAWSGSGFAARFDGTSLAVRMGGGQEYTVLVDGVVGPKFVPSGGGFALVAHGLPSGVHEVQVYRRTEAHLGESSLLGVDVGDGQLLAPSPAPARRLEVVGDSISCGYGNEGADQTCGFTPQTENHYQSYGALVARALGAELVTVGWSGKGVVCNYGDAPDSCTDPMPTYYDRTLPQRPQSRWDFSRWQPHAVVVNLGTNDFSTEVDPTPAEFEAAYVALLGRIRAAYADAVIFCTIGPMLFGEDLETARGAIARAVHARIAAGDAAVKVFELAPTNPAHGYGCDWHPSVRTHQVMADTLTAVLRAELGW